ncbi:DegV family protein [Marinococcus luteus]|uniref:DegV family protein n=1 Tax=Marinococcus luteus TaxID=1122204 RepID=UPI002ACCB4D1|nr:DegV family protein [Marinococcus luteus]MDZ5783902.1 DegV family protein [Marinococcus luteus]
MTQRIAWITDSTSSIDAETAAKYNIHIVPLSVVFENESYKENIEITTDEFYERLPHEEVFPTTSQPSVGSFSELFEQLKDSYDVGIAIHISSHLSGTLQTAQLAADMTGFPLFTVDSKMGAGSIRPLLTRGSQLADEGVAPEEIQQRLTQMAGHARGYLLLGSLEQAHKGGRISRGKLILGTLLKIHPLLTFDSGQIVPFEKIRTRKRAESRLLQIAKEAIASYQVEDMSIIYTTTKEKAETWKTELQALSPGLTTHLCPLSPVIGVHGGAETMGIMWYEYR